MFAGATAAGRTALSVQPEPAQRSPSFIDRDLEGGAGRGWRLVAPASRGGRPVPRAAHKAPLPAGAIPRAPRAPPAVATAAPGGGSARCRDAAQCAQAARRGLRKNVTSRPEPHHVATSGGGGRRCGTGRDEDRAGAAPRLVAGRARLCSPGSCHHERTKSNCSSCSSSKRTEIKPKFKKIIIIIIYF